jgi:4-amino-4-deoxy-L-arabinose transferase-like glycosyltransferase
MGPGTLSRRRGHLNRFWRVLITVLNLLCAAGKILARSALAGRGGASESWERGAERVPGKRADSVDLRVTARRWWPAGFALAFVATGLALSLRHAPLGDLGVEADFFAELAPAAEAVAAGHLDVANYPFKGPLYSLVLAPVHAALAPLGLDWYRSAVVLSLLASALTLLLVHRLSRRLAGERAAVVVVVLTAFTKIFFIHAHKAATDPLFMFLVVAAVTVLLCSAPRKTTWLATGALAGLAWLVRDIGVVVGAWATLVLLLVDPDHQARRRRLLAALCVWGGFALVAAPWLAVTRHQSGRWLASHNLQNIVDEFYVGARVAEVPVGGFASLGALVAHDPAYFAGHFLANLPRHFVADLNEVPGLTYGGLALAGMAVLVWRRPDRRQVAFLLLGFLMFLALGAVFHRPRFALPMVPAWALVTALALERLPRFRVRAALAVVACVVALHIGHIHRSIVFYDRQQPRHLATAIAAAPTWAAAAIAEKAGEVPGRRPVLMARKAHLAYYAHLAYVAYPIQAVDPPDLVARARARGADFLVVGEIERQLLPDRTALDHLEELPGVEVAWRDPQTTVYRLRPVRVATGS